LSSPILYLTNLDLPCYFGATVFALFSRLKQSRLAKSVIILTWLKLAPCLRDQPEQDLRGEISSGLRGQLQM